MTPILARRAQAGLLARMRAARRSGAGRRSGGAREPAPLRADLLSADQMELRGAALARTHRLGSRGSRNRLLNRLTANEAVLTETCALLTQAIRTELPLMPAGEWLLDNFYLIEEQVRTARRHLPRTYSSELPALRAGESDGLPRVYDIALQIIAHGDGRIDPESLRRFLAAYQSVTPLKLGELWAIPIMLRLALIENLRRVAARLSGAVADAQTAAHWAEQMMRIVERDPKNLVLVIADMARSNPPARSAFVAELARRLQGRTPAVALALTWVEQWLIEWGVTIRQLVQAESQHQAADQVSIANSIGSLRFLGTTDWRDFVEAQSVVHATLSDDPAGAYASMDFATRDAYRHVVERVARRSPASEGDVATAALLLAREASRSEPAQAHRHHVGYFLVDRGLPALERTVRMRASPADIARRTGPRLRFAAYLGAIAGLTAVFATALLPIARSAQLEPWLLTVAMLAGTLGASHLAVQLVNQLTSLLAEPGVLPRMDFRGGIPAASKTLVVVPTLLATPAGVASLLEDLERRYLANPDANLHFALLTDFVDASSESMPADAALVELAARGVEALNARYPREGGDLFLLLHRPRRYNRREGVWMGRERKRGKLADLNALLRGADGDLLAAGERGAGDRFCRIVGDLAVLQGTRYVITLDTDTQLPREAARKLVETMAHPLNRPRSDAATRRITGGYGILQPRVSATLTGARKSRYALLNAGDVGIDPYTRSVSDVYQDLAGEGSFIGKGIYDVDTFEFALGSRLPDNRILSHDLLEGCYARSGLVSDVQVYEDDPASFLIDARRRHRWMRGDWQIASWLWRRVPGPAGEPERNTLSFLSQWKIFDNLRRSLVAPALVLLLAMGWTIMPPARFWTGAVLGMMALPALIASLTDFATRWHEASTLIHLRALLESIARRLLQVVYAVATLPFEAFAALDAIGRTALRVLLTRRRLLQWTASGQFDARRHAGMGLFLRSMIAGPLLALALVPAIAVTHPVALPLALPILAAWLVSPLAAWWLSQPLKREPVAIDASQRRFLRLVARRTWGFFEQSMSEEDHGLPPDNVQFNPERAVAHRTSPTNVGLALLSGLAAHDLGYVTAGELIARTGATFATLDRLARYRGHFFNWYDTRTLEPLHPRYVSSVDSGNLVGHLITLREGLAEIAHTPILTSRALDGLVDTLVVLRASDPAASASLEPLSRELESAAVSPPRTLSGLRAFFERIAAALPAPPENETHPARFWYLALARQCAAALAELDALAPWSALPAPPRTLQQLPDLTAVPALRDIGPFAERVLAATAHADAQAVDQASAAEPGCSATAPADDAARAWLGELTAAVRRGADEAGRRLDAIEALVRAVGPLTDIDYDFLYDPVRRQLAIGFNVSERRRDAGFYDLLASEARLTTFVAIAHGKLPQESWFALGRLLASKEGEPILLSWSGSMFEYLMPLLVMPSYEDTLLDETARAAVARQVRYGRRRGVPWGISESGYNVVDSAMVYQYRAFGVPGLGLQRGLAEDLVIAPYASALALMVAPREACRNLAQLAALGVLGELGFYEAIDFTSSRSRRGESGTIVRSHLAHHQGMSLIATAAVLTDAPMPRRFSADPALQSGLLLLQERMPRVAGYANNPELVDLRTVETATESPVRVFSTPDTRTPAVQLLSNGRYHVMVTNAGGGSSRWRDLAVTRWREDGTRDPWGVFCYLRDTASGRVWSPAYAPTHASADAFEANLTEPRVEFRRRDGDWETQLEIVVSPEDDVELRRLHVTNRGRGARALDVASYAEVVLASAASDALHPAFSNLFVQTEILAERGAILCTRRPRAHSEHTPSLLHLMSVHGGRADKASFETDRARFVGRGRSTSDPEAMQSHRPLSGTQGSVLDPVVAIRQRIDVEAGQTVIVDMVTGVAEHRAACLALVEKYQDRGLADRALEMAWTHSHVVLRQLNITEVDAQLYNRIAGAIVYAGAAMRTDGAVIARNRRGQSSLWGYAISGDLPIVLVQIRSPENIDLVRQCVQAHAYWRLKGLAADLVIVNEERGGYRQVLHDQIMGLVAAGVDASVIDRPGGIFLRGAEQIGSEDLALLQSVARVVFSDADGTLVEQLRRPLPAEPPIPRLVPSREGSGGDAANGDATVTADDVPARSMDNGLGGFSADGREYVITLAPGAQTPAPWVNVIANPHFGTVASESGPVYTWFENAHEYRLTPWHNDPVTGVVGEAFYLRDESSGRYWSPTPLPARGSGDYTCRHGFGYSVYAHVQDGVASELTVYVAVDAPVKFSVLKVRNDGAQTRTLSAVAYVDWVLGDLPHKTAMHVVTEIDPGSGALFARNAYHPELPELVAFLDVDEVTRTLSGDRTEFIGRNGSLARPAALSRARLSGRVGAAMDPCGAVQIPFELAPGQTRQIIYRMGVGRGPEEASRIVNHHRRPGTARDALDAVKAHWAATLGSVQIATPEPAVDVLANGWLVYQTLSCRIWGRTGFYQSGGAYGFRDQLQDCMALVHAAPQLIRDHLLRSASRQFVEGDVQHWWHPPLGRGVRSRCSDDMLWLPLATCRYVDATGDWDVLTEPVPFLEGRQLAEHEESYYDLPTRSHEHASLYQHCVRAIEYGLRLGAHGLPLMGSGDWNDGMNNVGIGGRGESVWLGFFLCAVLADFAKLADRHGDTAFARRCQAQAEQLRESLERHCWDGDWYLRAFFDDGSPLGSHRNDECRIDSVTQSWAVLSGAGAVERATHAMQSVDRLLVRRDAGLVALLDPPFDRLAQDPGYIRGYVPGVRENGGQYTHGAIWAAMAFAALRDADRAWEVARLINPILHATDPDTVARYRAEPYVVAADVYAAPPHTGRGGWSWYTGSAGWMYRLIVESLLGVRRQENRLCFQPCLPAAWPSCEVRYRFGATTYRITLRQLEDEAAEPSVTLDGEHQPRGCIPLVDDYRDHVVTVLAPRPQTQRAAKLIAKVASARREGG